MQKLLFSILIFQTSILLYGQNDSDSSKINSIHLGEVIFSASKSKEMKSEVPYQLEIIKSADIEFSNPQNSADMLVNSGSVFVQKSQQGGGSPSIRGFEASRILLVIDGIRMNNAIYRSGHLQDVLTIDNSIIERTEILYGPASTIYGSDALGGVIHFYTKMPKFAENNFYTKPRMYTRWSSANRESTTHFDLQIGRNKIASFTSCTFSNFNNLRAGAQRNSNFENFFLRKEYVENINGTDSIRKNSNVNLQLHSGYWQFGFLQKFSIKQTEKILHTINMLYSNSSNIPRYDRLSEYANGKLRFAEWNYGPQKRFSASMHTDIQSVGRFFSRLNLILAYQKIAQERINRLYKNMNRSFQLEEVQVFSINTDLSKKINLKHELKYGLEAYYNDVQSTAKSVNIQTNSETSAATRYPDGGSYMITFASYLSHRWNITPKIILNEGIRYNLSSLKSKFIETKYFPFPFTEIKQKSNATTGSIGLVYKASNYWNISFTGSSGFRTPNVDDLTKIFDSSPGKLIVANPDLKPEYAYNIDFGIKTTIINNSSLSIHAWHSKLLHAMVLKNFQYNGQDSIEYKGVKSQIQAMQNADKAFTQGISISYAIEFNLNFSLSSTLTYTYGRYRILSQDSLIPFDHISPLFGKTSLTYNIKNTQSEFSAIYNGWKRLKDYSPSGEDNLQYATPLGMPSWFIYNYKFSMILNKYFTIQTGIENILDTHYRYFASGISAAGRNVYFTLRLQI